MYTVSPAHALETYQRDHHRRTRINLLAHELCNGTKTQEVKRVRPDPGFGMTESSLRQHPPIWAKSMYKHP